jgi:cytochrome c oxidase assembly protein subunit 11
VSGKSKTVAAILAALSLIIARVVARVPLYSLFCNVTGFGGTPRINATAPAGPAQSRTITVRFDSNVMKGLPWSFAPNQAAQTVRLGEPSLASFTATNKGGEAIVGTAAFNVTPAKAGIYVNKIQCFCFSEQKLNAGQTMEMPVQYYIDPAIASDPNTSDITAITLSYSFFRTPQRNEGAS